MPKAVPKAFFVSAFSAPFFAEHFEETRGDFGEFFALPVVERGVKCGELFGGELFHFAAFFAADFEQPEGVFFGERFLPDGAADLFFRAFAECFTLFGAGFGDFRQPFFLFGGQRKFFRDALDKVSAPMFGAAFVAVFVSGGGGKSRCGEDAGKGGGAENGGFSGEEFGHECFLSGLNNAAIIRHFFRVLSFSGRAGGGFWRAVRKYAVRQFLQKNRGGARKFAFCGGFVL